MHLHEDLVAEAYACPGCGALIENEIAVSTDPVLRDIEIAVDERLFQRQQEAAD